MSRDNRPKNMFNSLAIECEVVEGLEDIAEQESFLTLSETPIQLMRYKGAISFYYTGSLRDLMQLRSVVAVYTVQNYPIPRPKALLGHQYFKQLLSQIHQVFDLFPNSTFQTMHLSAAGSNSSVMRRLKDELAEQIKLEIADEQGDLLLRVRKRRQSSEWQTLVRISPRPLATRSWRTIDMPGALNASVAFAMVNLTRPTPHDKFLNIACGSGTLLIERAKYMSADQIVGFDLNQAALELAKINVTSAQIVDMVQLVNCDIRHMPSGVGSCNAIVADLPFGQLVGSHAENQILYPTVLDESARVIAEGSRFVVISHEVRLMEACFRHSPYWYLVEERIITLRGLHPRIYVFERNSLQYSRHRK